MDHSKIITYLEGDILQNAPLLAALRRGTGEILAGGQFLQDGFVHDCFSS